MSLGKGEGNFDSALGRYRHRDERQTPSSDTVVVHPAKKNTRRWCKGRPGREHDYSVFVPWGGTLVAARRRACSVCGRMTGPVIWTKADMDKEVGGA